MYHAIVRQNVRQGFAHLSQGNYAAVLAQFSADVLFSFGGHHALGGEQRGVAAARAWFERLYKIFPGLQFEVRSVTVSGWPWNTLVVTEFEVQAPLPGGRNYQNRGTQILRLCWGKISEDRIMEDTVLLTAALEYLASQGIAEASAKPLE